MNGWLYAGSVEALRRNPKVVKGGRSGIAAFYHEGEVPLRRNPHLSLAPCSL